MMFPREEYWSGLPFPSPGDLPNPEIKPAFPALAGNFFTAEAPGWPIERKFLNLIKTIFDKLTVNIMLNIKVESIFLSTRQGCPLLPIFILISPSHTSGEGNGTPLQYSCLENPMDGGAW